MVTRRRLVLNAEERDEMSAWRDHAPQPQLRERCAALLRIAAGESPHAVARSGVIKPRDPDTIYGWITLYEQGGIPALAAHLHGGSIRGRLRPRTHRHRARAAPVPATGR